MVAAIDWSTFAPANERFPGLRLRSYRADLVFTANLRGRDEIVIFVIEHKSGPDPGLTGQVLRYVVHLRHIMQRRGTAGTPLIVPIVLYHGTEPLVLQPPASDLDPDTAAAFAAHEPRLTLLVDDLSRRSEAELRGDGHSAFAQLTRLCLTFLPRLTNAEVLAAIDRWGDLLRAIEADEGPPLPEDALDTIGWYVLDTTDVTEEQLQMAFANNLNRPEGQPVTTGQKIRLESRMQGRAEGRAEGRTEGRTEGLAEGLVVGRADTILRVLGKRFGPLPEETIQRVQSATLAELDLWTDRMLDGKTLADVLVPV